MFGSATKSFKAVFVTVVLVGSFVAIAGEGPAKVDSKLAPYQKQSGVSGNISSVGSDTLNNLMALWSEGFRKQYPNVNIQVQGKGSSTAPPALAQGVAQLGPMSRPMKSEEIEAFEKQMGFKPTAVGVGLDALAVYVNKDNPIQELSMEQIDAIFSKTLKGGHDGSIETWNQVGLTGELANRPLSLYGRNSASGTYGYFKKHALYKGDFKSSVKEQPGSASVVMAISEDLSGIGYSGIGYTTSGVKAIALSKKPGGPYFNATAENVLKRKYPLGRMLLVYVSKEPNKALPKVVEEFLKFVVSKEGQEVVVKSGYIPLPSQIADKQVALMK